MKYWLLFFILLSLKSYSQFEGRIVYKQTYKSDNPDLTSEVLSQFLGDTHEYYVDGANYASLVNGMAESKSVHFPVSKEIIRYYPNGDSIVVVNILNPDSELIEAKLTDGSEKVLSWDCKSMVMNTSQTNQTYYYSDELKLKSKLFKDHKYGNYDTYTKLTGALPLKYVMVFPEFTITGTAVSVEEMELSDSFFEELIPKDKLSKN